MDKINSLIQILIYGSLFLLSFILIANPLKVNRKANLWFGIFLFLWSTFWFEEICILTEYQLQNIYIETAIKFFQFSTPIFFYYSVVFYTNPDFKFKKKELIFFILPIIYLVGLITKHQFNEQTAISSILNILIIIQAIYFTIYSYIKIQFHKKRIRLFSSNTNEIDLVWLEYIITSLFVLSLFIGIYNVFFNGDHLNVLANMVSLTIIFFVAFNCLKQKEIFLLDENERNLIFNTEKVTVIEKRKIISDEEIEILKTKLIKLMEDKKLFLDPDLTLIKLAKLLNLTPHKVSYLINKGFNENFFWFVNRYRVNRVKELLLNKDYKHMSILGIAYESGFNSKTSFNTTFKKITSQTPSEFKKISSSL